MNRDRDSACLPQPAAVSPSSSSALATRVAPARPQASSGTFGATGGSGCELFNPTAPGASCCTRRAKANTPSAGCICPAGLSWDRFQSG